MWATWGGLYFVTAPKGGPLCWLLGEADMMLAPREAHYVGFLGMMILCCSPQGGPLGALLGEAHIMS